MFDPKADLYIYFIGLIKNIFEYSYFDRFLRKKSSSQIIQQ